MSRKVLLVLSDHPDAASMVKLAAEDLYKTGDSVQLVWVTNHAELLKEAAADGATEPAFVGQDADKSRAVEEEEAAKELQKSLAAKYGPTLEALQIPYQIHILPTSMLHLGASIVQCAAVESAAVVVLPKAASAFITNYMKAHFDGPVVLV